MSKIVGIDLGTTFSSIASLNEIGKPDIFSVDGERVIPSAVYFESNNKFHVGEIAINALSTENQSVARWIKKTMGEDFYNITNDGIELEKPRIIIGKKWLPSELSSFVLKHLANNFEKINGPIKGAVVTVPAYFDEKRRKATMEAANLAGLPILGIVNEPTAAAIFYSSIHDINGKNLVFDLGGGTFDITIMDVMGDEITVICSEGDSNLGGFDFDKALFDYFKSEFKNENNVVDFTEEDNANWLLKCESVKKNLSKLSNTKFSASVGNTIFSQEIDKYKFNEITRKLVSRIEMLVELALEEANIEANDIDNVILCGGSTRIPILKDMLKRIFNMEPLEVGNVDEAVSLGAAIYAGILAVEEFPEVFTDKAKKNIDVFKVQDVCNHSYGTLALSIDEFTSQPIIENKIIIHKNTKLPAEVMETFYTIHEGQNSIDATITQGESADRNSVNIISDGLFKLPSQRKAGSPIEVTYKYDRNQRMKCIFKDVESGKTHEVELEMKNEISSDNIFDEFDL